ncbi:unnamed protein product [Kuraishia capsulata CBS 1993]|uniref:Survival protein SurE-like phosphatase/nucleotidase domain-containing protein n=1 Tax=Kuraishia capsulata CBS 1993 TaxID=1382522 RepID=W6MJD1_9ASCO|nr:uncharacterized protein KUCA_T00002612001 [Kuraishia capsulata CBS 1993]CDK26639.1 unnamed protein product [Kuraishia capsulata CBS 1993]
MKLLSILLCLDLVASLNILITNEQAIDTPIVRKLHRVLSKSHKVVSVVPKRKITPGNSIYINGSPFLSPTDTIASESIPDFPEYEEVERDVWSLDANVLGSVLFGLDFILPTKYPGLEIDLIIAGPRTEPSAGPFANLLSGVFSVMRFGMLRNIPTVAISSIPDLYADDPKVDDLYVEYCSSFINALHEMASVGNDRILPKFSGLNINFPLIGMDRYGCDRPLWQETKEVGGYAQSPSIIEVDGKYRIVNAYSIRDQKDKNSLFSELSSLDTCHVGVTFYSDYEDSWSELSRLLSQMNRDFKRRKTLLTQSAELKLVNQIHA